ncbi:MAG: tRNA (adenosine(37)-N6)-threonylcarbamoyltransferase complex transferase subunit TsaD [Planctomycetota bacterium]
MTRMLTLGIESSCDETACAVVEGERTVRSSVVASQHDLHAMFGGVVPEIASRAHAERILPIVEQAMGEAGVRREDLSLIAVGHRPGLIGSLLIGLTAAKALAWSWALPLVGVDHVHAHLHAADLGRDAPPEFPALGLVVSGGHTSIYRAAAPGELARLGATIDDAIGEAFDKAASILGLPQPGGPAIDALSAEDGADDRAFDFPVSRLGKGSLDLSFSGLKTALLYEVRGRPQPRRVPGKPELRADAPPVLTAERRRDIAASFQRAAVRAIIVKLGRALDASSGVRTLIAGGGVCANTRLRRELESFASERGLELRLPPMVYCVDNAAMIAGLGRALHERGERAGLDLRAVPTASA